MSDFLVQRGRVVMIGNHKPVELTDWQTDQLLDLFEDAGAADLFNRLYQAQRKAMGDLHMPRVSSMAGLRLVSSNSPKEIVREQLRRSLEASRGRTEHLCGDIFDAATITSPNPDNAA